MKPNTVVVGYLTPSPTPADQETSASKSKAKDLNGASGYGGVKVYTKLEQQMNAFPHDTETISDLDYVSMLKDINSAGKNILIARKYVCIW